MRRPYSPQTGFSLRGWLACRIRTLVCGLLCGVLASSVAAAEEGDLESQLAALAAQNETLMALARQQQAQIEELTQRLNRMQEADQRQALEIGQLRDETSQLAGQPRAAPSVAGMEGWRLYGEAGLAFFAGEADTEFPNEEFRIDDMRLFLEAELAQGIYLTTVLELFRRESGNRAVEPGEVFVDFENPFGLEELDRALNIRAGRFMVPFGEEYLYRYVMENPLVSHSVADLWGLDEGFGAYGQVDRFSYAVALQNGSYPILRDLDPDKSIAARIGYDFDSGVRLSGSWMRTGDMDATAGELSEIWIGNVVFSSIGSAQTTRYGAELAQLDGSYAWGSGSVRIAVGRAWYEDDDPLGDNSRELDFFSAELVRHFGDSLYAAARYSGLEVPGGYSFSGHGPRNRYFLTDALTERLWRLSLGLGYWLGDRVVFKTEYSFENGELSDGRERENSDQLSAQIGVRF